MSTDPPHPAEIQELYEYNRWANRRALDAVEPLSREALNRDLGSSFRSIRDTIEHVLAAEWIWLMRWKGTSPSGPPEGWGSMDVRDLRSRWAPVETEQTEFVAALTPGQLGAGLEYWNTAGDRFEAPLWQLMRHLVNHSTYHRGQIATQLRQVGAVPVATDLVLFYRERSP